MRIPFWSVLAVTLLVGPVAFAADDGPPMASLDALVAEVDTATQDDWKALGLVPTATATDEEFLRRATLDLTGRLPTVAEARAFLDDASPTKRDALIDRLTLSEAAALHFGEWYGRLLLGRDRVQAESRRALEAWLTEAWTERRPYRDVVRDLLSASGPVEENGAGAYVAQFAGDVPALAGRTARLFLGVQVQCAQCHDHPWDEWTEADFHGFATYFSRARRQKIPTPVDTANSLHGRARRHLREAQAGVQRLEKLLAAARTKVQASRTAFQTAEKAARPHAAAVAKVAKPHEAATARQASIRKLAARAATLAAQAEARTQGAPKEFARTLANHAQTARELATLLDEQARAAALATDAWQQRLEAARTQAKPHLDKRAAAKQALDAAQQGLTDLEALGAAAQGALEGLNALQVLTKESAGLLPALYNDTYASKGERIPPPAWRVIDAGGTLKPKVDPKHPTRGNGMPRPLRGTAAEGAVDAAKLRREFAAWATTDANPFLAKAAVNRLAARFWGRGFVDPVDDLTGNGERFADAALEILADDLVASGWDLQRLVRALTRTRAYQRTSAVPAGEVASAPAPVRELGPQVALRAMVAAVLPGTAEAATGGPRAKREAWVKRYGDLFDDASDRPATEPQGGIRRALWLMNGAPAAELFRGRKEGLAAQLVAKNVEDERAVETIYLALLTRRPTAAETQAVVAALPARPAEGDRKARQAWARERIAALEDVMWALLNGSEFLTAH